MADRRRLEILVLPDADAVARAAVRRIAGLVRRRPTATLGLATGSTMQEIYRGLVAAHRRGLDLSGLTTFNMDEYLGLGPENPGSFAAYMQSALFGPADMAAASCHVPPGRTEYGDAAAIAYERAIAEAGGIDLQLLGIGENGHIAFNEPGSSFASRTRVVELAPMTRSANRSGFSGGEVPRRAITIGIATILEARALLLLATGERKAEALAGALDGPVDEACPASAIRLHPRATVICDRAAASRLRTTG
jgi:glucosamine-6-phosphate deaminase